MKRILIIVAFVLTICAGVSIAASRNEKQKGAEQSAAKGTNVVSLHNCASCHSLSKDEAGAIFKGLGEVTDVKVSPVKGLYEVTVRQKNRQAVAYLDFGKKILVPGPIYDITSKRPVTPPPVDLPLIISKEDMEKIPVNNSIVMGKPDGKRRMFVFTDPDCPFCGKLHKELIKLVSLEPDLTIYIKMYPLDMHPGAYDKARVILGANSLEMLEKAFAGEKLPAPGERDKKEPVDESLKLGASLGIDGTPAILFPSGKLVAGFRDVKTLRALLQEDKVGK